MLGLMAELGPMGVTGLIGSPGLVGLVGLNGSEFQFHCRLRLGDDIRSLEKRPSGSSVDMSVGRSGGARSGSA